MKKSNLEKEWNEKIQGLNISKLSCVKTFLLIRGRKVAAVEMEQVSTLLPSRGLYVVNVGSDDGENDNNNYGDDDSDIECIPPTKEDPPQPETIQDVDRRIFGTGLSWYVFTDHLWPRQRRADTRGRQN